MKTKTRTHEDPTRARAAASAARPSSRGSARLAVLVAVVSGLCVAAFLVGRGFAPPQEAPQTAASAAASRYHCPMHPTYVSDRPGDCPICGMSLVPITKEETPRRAAAASVPGRAVIFVSPDRQQQIGLTTAPVERRSLARTIRTVGRIDYAEPHLAWVNTKIAGWIEKLHVDSTGALVEKGQPLLDIYSPELLSAQEEYLISLEARRKLAASSDPDAAAGGETLLAAARRRLQLWDIGADQIARLERTGASQKTLTIVSPVRGHVVEKTAFPGKSVAIGENLYRIADLTTVWIYADIYEHELSAVAGGQRATVTSSYLPGRTFDARVDYVYPYVEQATRTVKVRLDAPNPDLALRPEMWTNVSIAVDTGDGLTAPASSVIDTGTRQVAFVDRGEGELEPRELTIGTRTDDYVEVLSGLSEGEKVVTRALFLIDSESQLKAAIAGMGAAGPHQH